MGLDISDLLKLPFFGVRHREIAELALGWTNETEETGEPDDAASLAAACRKIVGSLGESGLLVPTVRLEDQDRLDVRTICLVRQILAYHSGLCDFAFAMQALGSGPISLFGTQQQRSLYLAPVARGHRLAAFALSEERSGSDVASIETTARADGDGYILDGSKTWISNTGIADNYVVFARTGEAPAAKGISAFIVEAGTPGFFIDGLIDLIAPHPLGTLRFDNCRVPKRNLIGQPGDGFRIAMATLDVMRSSVGAAALGFARRALDTTIDHVQGRQLFGQPLSNLQGTQFRLADMVAETEAAELLVYRAAWLKDNGQARVTREAALAKMQATEGAQKMIDSAVQLAGGNGVVKGSVPERLYREIRSLRIYEGATEVQKVIIARAVLRGAGGSMAAE